MCLVKFCLRTVLTVLAINTAAWANVPESQIQDLIRALESPAIPKLEQIYKDNAWIRVIEELEKLGPAAKPATEALLKLQDESQLTYFLIKTLVAIKADSAATVEFYTKATHNQSEEVRYIARYGLKQLGAEEQSPAVLNEAVYRQNEYEIFKKMFDSSDPTTHKQGVDGLFYILNRQLPHYGLLPYATKEQHAARELLREEALHGDPEFAAPLISFAAQKPNLVLSPAEALEAAKKLPSNQNSIQIIEKLNQLIKMAKNNSEARSLSIAEALDKYQRDLSGKDEESMLNALRQLERLNQAALPASSTIIKTLDNETLPSNIRIHAAETLSRIRPANEEAQLALLAATRDKDPQLRRTAMHALDLNTPDKATLVPVFLKRLDDSSQEVRIEALLFLHAQAPLSTPETGKFIEVWYQAGTGGSMHAMDILRSLKLSAREYREIVIKDAIEKDRPDAVRLLRTLVTDKEEITLGMITLIETEQVVARKVRLINQLALLKQDAKAALPMLNAISNSSDEYLKKSAEKAILRISSP